MFVSPRLFISDKCVLLVWCWSPIIFNGLSDVPKSQVDMIKSTVKLLWTQSEALDRFRGWFFSPRAFWKKVLHLLLIIAEEGVTILQTRKTANNLVRIHCLSKHVIVVAVPTCVSLIDLTRLAGELADPVLYKFWVTLHVIYVPCRNQKVHFNTSGAN